jgi:hypothetical protein
MTMHAFYPVRRTLAGKIMSLHHSGMTATPRIRDHVQPLPFRQLCDRHYLSHLEVVLSIITTKLSRKPMRLTSRLNQSLLASLLTNLPTSTTNVSYLTTLRTAGKPARLLTKSHLNRRITMTLKSTNLSDNARAGFNDRNRDHGPTFGVNLRHSNFSTK